MKLSTCSIRSLRILVFLGLAVLLALAWLRWVPYDRQWRKPADLIEGFLISAQKRDYIAAKAFFSSRELTNIAAWEGSFEHWCDQFYGYRSFQVGRTGAGKSGHYWTEVFGVNPAGSREFVERIYAKRFDGLWSLEYGLSYDAWLSLNKGTTPPLDVTSKSP